MKSVERCSLSHTCLLLFILSAATYLLPSFHPNISFLRSAATSRSIKYKSNDETQQVLTINLIGERHCGTKWIYKHLKDCFGSQVTVLDRYTRFKHWFQYEEDISDAKHYYPANSTIVVAMFRDPYNWVNAMQRMPYHALDHHNLSWKKFVTTPWTIERGVRDMEIINNGTNSTTCVHRFSFNEVVPCTVQDRNNWHNGTHNYTNKGLMYELNHDGSGNPYNSIVDLRRDKIKNFLSVRNYDAVKAFFPVQYEYVVSNGSADLIDAIENATGFEAKCKRSPPRQLIPKQLDSNFIKWMNENVDWEVERMVGYYKRSKAAT